MTLCNHCGFIAGGTLCGMSNPEACAAAALAKWLGYPGEFGAIWNRG